MEKLYVNLGENSYNISFHTDFNELVEVMAEIHAPKKLMLVTDTNVEKLYGSEVMDVLKGAGYDVDCFAFQAGEEHKTVDTVLDICSKCMEHRLDRKSMIVALGGGVTGDMAGFAASMYMRGISFVQIPTTLLSQSDSSVGGKTGVDFGGAKNILGAFLQPKHVYINVSVLKTLPRSEFVSGMGEVIKHAIIKDSEFFSFLSEASEEIKGLESQLLLPMSLKNCSIKADIVERDEKENGVRAHLNFGHTIGHAIESASNFALTHGECVALGMLGAAYIACERGLITDIELESITELLDLYGFNMRTEINDFDKILSLMFTDKKTINGKIRFVLPVAIGAVDIFDDVTEDEIIAALEFIKSEE